MPKNAVCRVCSISPVGAGAGARAGAQRGREVEQRQIGECLDLAV